MLYVERTVVENFPLMPSHVGVTAICDDLKVTSDPQLALLVSEIVQRKVVESGRSLNISKCRILVHPDSAHLVVWPKNWRPGLCATLPVVSTGMKLLGAPIGTEVFRRDFVEQRISKATASVPALAHLAPWATWNVLRYCVNERINYLAQVTEFPLVQESLAQMDAVIDQAILRAAGLPLASPGSPEDSLVYLTTCTLRSLPTALGGLGIRRYSGLAGELACLRARTVFYEFAEKFAPRWLEGASVEFWQPILLGAAENRVWTDVAGLFAEDPSLEDDPAQPQPSVNVAGMFRAYYLASGESSPLPCCTNPDYSAADRRSWRIQIRGAETNIKTEGRKIQGVWFDALVQLLHSRGRLAEACLLKSNKFPRSGCWLAGPGGYLSGTTHLTRPEYTVALRLRLLRSPASLDVGDAEGCVWCRCNRRISLALDPMHFFHCPSSQGQFIRRHNHICDAIMDQVADSVRSDTCLFDIAVESEPLLRLCLPALPSPSSSAVAEGVMEIDTTTAQFADDDNEEYIEEARRPYRARMTLKDWRQRNAADKAAGQCRGDCALYVDGSATIVDVAVGDATAPSYRQPPPSPSPVAVADPSPVATTSSDVSQQSEPPTPRGGRKKKTTKGRRRIPPQGSPTTPRLPGQSFAIEHRVWEKKSKYRPFLGADGVDDPKRFVPFVLEASGRLGPDAAAFLEYLKSLFPFPILRFRALVSVISVKHNAQMALRWVRYLRYPI